MASTDVIGGGNIEPRALEDEMRTAYLDYAMSVIVGRALPDVRDGLKPVHRRILYSMDESGQGPTRPYSKCARIVGEVMGNYHPHGDSAIYDTLVRMAQDFSHALPAGRRPGQLRLHRRRSGRGHALHRGAPRRASPPRCSATSTRTRSTSRPTTTAPSASRSSCRRASPTCSSTAPPGIAVGMATNIPPHNLREVIDAVVAFIDDPAIDTAGLMQHIKGPDFPTGGDHPRPPGHPRRLRDRPRPRPRPRARPTSSHRARQGGDHRHRAALHGQEGRATAA